ncbi:MAG: hypothetical protein A2Z04_04940 [Chloroflexi bacterium RBG_16_57_9]|nr:MAG: hypothetical protein A2Z04_04940 [Chloroflexi bacterium RBG_16_57_9]
MGPGPGEKRSVEISAKTVDEAIQHGLAQLGVSREATRIEVLHEGSRGIFGFGGENARVRLTVMPDAAPESPPPSPVAPATAPESPPPVRAAPLPAPPKAPQPVAAEGVDTHLREIALVSVQGLLKAMGVSAEVTVHDPTPAMTSSETDAFIVNIAGRDLGFLIGRRGETLSALQFLTRLMVNQQTRQWANIILDVDGWKVRRERSLRDLAQRMAERVIREGRSVALEPMPAYERRIIHLTLREHPAVITMSIGDGDARKVTIRPKR